MSLKQSLVAAAAVLALGVAAPAFAQSAGGGGNGGGNSSGNSNGGANGDTNINSFVRQAPNGMAPTTNGVPHIVDNQESQPVIRYQGPRGPGMQEGSVPRIVDNREGQPVIQYGGKPVAGDISDSTGMQAGLTNPSGAIEPGMRDGARGGMHGRMHGGMQGGGMRGAAGSGQVRPLLNSARASLQRGQYAAAANTLERAETQLLNSGMDGNQQTVQALGEARAAANRRDRNGAMQALNGVMR